LAEEESAQEREALELGDAALAMLTRNERAHATAIAIGLKNVLCRIRNGMPEGEGHEVEAAGDRCRRPGHGVGDPRRCLRRSEEARRPLWLGASFYRHRMASINRSPNTLALLYVSSYIIQHRRIDDQGLR
jgi:hypothetical protein